MSEQAIPSPTVSDVNSVTKKLDFVCGQDLISERYESRIKEQAKRAKVKGFRPGTAPRAIVEKMYGKEILGEVQRDLLVESFRSAINDLKLNVVGEPEVNIEKQLSLSEQFEFSVTVGLFPEPEVDFEGSYKLEVERGEVKEGDIDAVIGRLRESKAETKPLAFRNTAKEGDIITGMMKVTVEGEATRKPEPVTVPLEEGYLPAELLEKVVGQEIGSSVEADGKLSEKHEDENLRGKNVRYVFELQSLAEKELPELDDEFAKGLGLSVESVLELRLKIRERLEQEVEKEARTGSHVALLEKLIEQNPFEVPQSLIDEEIKSMLFQMGALDPKKVKPDEVSAAPFRDHFGAQAEKRVKSAVVLDRLAQKYAQPLSEEERQKSYQALADQYGGVDVQRVIEAMKSSGDAEAFEREQVRSKLLDDLVDKCEIVFIEPKEDTTASADENAAEKV